MWLWTLAAFFRIGQFVVTEIDYPENKVRFAVCVEWGQRRCPLTLLEYDRSTDCIGFSYVPRVSFPESFLYLYLCKTSHIVWNISEYEKGSP